MAYTPTAWINDAPPPLSAANLNKLTDELRAQATAASVSHVLPVWVNGVAPALTDAAPLNEIERVTHAVAVAYNLNYSVTTWGSDWSPARNASNFNKLEQQAAANRNAIDLVPVTWEGPITITSGQTITGRMFQSTTSGPAITVNTTQPVIIQNCQIRMMSAGERIIDAYNVVSGVDLTIRNCTITGRDDWSSPRWLTCQQWKNLLIQNNTIINTRGIELWPNQRAVPTTVITKNRHTNIKGTTIGSTFGEVGNFIQLRVIWGSPQHTFVNNSPGEIFITWNEIINEYNRSNPEDLFSLFKTGRCRVRDNMCWHQSKPAGWGASSQNGITIDPMGEPSTLYDNIIERNQLVEGYAIGMFGGNNNQILSNRIVSDGFWNVPGGGTTPMTVGYEGLWVAPGFVGNHAHGNIVGYIGSQGRQDGRLIGCVEGEAEWNNNTHMPSPIDQSDKNAEWTHWQSKLAANGIVIGA